MIEIEKILKVKGSFETLLKSSDFEILNSSVNFEGFDMTLTVPAILDEQPNKIQYIYLNVSLLNKACQVDEIHFSFSSQSGEDNDKENFEQKNKASIVKNINKKINNPEEILEFASYLKKACLKYSQK